MGWQPCPSVPIENCGVLQVNAAIALLCLLFFSLMRLRRLTRKFYMPRQCASLPSHVPQTRCSGQKARALRLIRMCFLVPSRAEDCNIRGTVRQRSVSHSPDQESPQTLQSRAGRERAACASGLGNQSEASAELARGKGCLSRGGRASDQSNHQHRWLPRNGGCERRATRHPKPLHLNSNPSLRRFQAETRTAGKPRTLPKKFAGWLGPAWATSEEELVRVAGYDAAMYVKILTYSASCNRRTVTDASFGDFVTAAARSVLPA